MKSQKKFLKIIFISLLLLFIALATQSYLVFRSINFLQAEITTLTQTPNRDCKVVSGKKHIYKGECLPKDYQAKMLTRLSPRACYLDTVKYLDVRAKLATEKLIKEAEEDGMCLVVSSGYRSKEDQKRAIKEITAKSSGMLDNFAAPGSSEHHTGLAVDFAACPMKNGERDDSVERPELKKSFSNLSEYDWLQENAQKYGFYQSYKESNKDKTGYPPEPWHWKLIVR